MVCPGRPWELLFLVEVKASLFEWVSNRLERQCSFVELLRAEFDPLGRLEYRRGGSSYSSSAELLHLHWDALDHLVGGWLECPRMIYTKLLFGGDLDLVKQRAGSHLLWGLLGLWWLS